ncbi:MAG: DUF503 domain-containing protein [Spirochaetales bacterium]|nr:DUF503 domain-containing protein [Spirochaetales bacterium]
MVVSVFQSIIEVPGLQSIKEKRRILKSLKDTIINKYKISAAEVGSHDSLRFIHIGAALVSNSKKYGESVLQKVFNYIEENSPGRIIDWSIFSENYTDH